MQFNRVSRRKSRFGQKQRWWRGLRVHSVPSYKERSYKERLVETFQSKEQILVEI